jgi:hypothetical protein
MGQGQRRSSVLLAISAAFIAGVTQSTTERLRRTTALSAWLG